MAIAMSIAVEVTNTAAVRMASHPALGQGMVGLRIRNPLAAAGLAASRSSESWLAIPMPPTMAMAMPAPGAVACWEGAETIMLTIAATMVVREVAAVVVVCRPDMADINIEKK